HRRHARDAAGLRARRLPQHRQRAALPPRQPARSGAVPGRAGPRWRDRVVGPADRRDRPARGHVRRPGRRRSAPALAPRLDAGATLERPVEPPAGRVRQRHHRGGERAWRAARGGPGAH
ncbi:hypothetical protein RZS08_58290, partial [Arthrospira platensis SPKY1]|nr:hypothetical protein [Arthrospira platensis SPKY1]